MFWRSKKKSNDKENNIEFGIDKEADLACLLRECTNNLHKHNDKLITKAFHWCYEANRNRVLKSGDPFYTYPLSVALIIINEIALDDTSVISVLLAGAIHQNSPYSLSDISVEFSGTITEIVENLIAIKTIDPGAFSQLENYRRILLSLFKDVRIILIMLADKLHSLRTLEYLSEEKQLHRAKEAMEVYAPFAQRFGLFHLKWEIEDHAFKYINPGAYNEIKNALKLTRVEREEYLKKFTKPLQDRIVKVDLFKKKNIGIEITARAKHIYSIFNKMIAREKGMDELYDLFAVRIIIDSEDNSLCFLAYGVLTELYKPVPGTFKNYISSPKKNGYQSLHTAVFGPDDKPVEVQIRTRKMHEVSERGVAAHFDYKRGLLPAQSVLDDKNLLEWMNHVRGIFENAVELENPEEILESVKNNLFQDEIYVFTPKKEFRVLPKDSTPLDFAYNIHSEIGNHCIGAKVNSRVVPLNYKLKSGEQIEILTSKKQKPSKEWLEFVITNRAKAHINKYFKDEYRNHFEKGRENWDKLLNYMKLMITEDDFANILKELNFDDNESFYVAVGSEALDLTLLYQYMKDKYYQNGGDANLNIAAVFNGTSEEEKKNNTDNLIQSGAVNVNYADCCNPLPGDPIVGVVDESGEVVVHHKDCRRVQEYRIDHQFSIFEIEWPQDIKKEFSARLKITASEDSEVINSITHAILMTNDVGLKSFNIDSKKSGMEGNITLKIKNLTSLSEVINKIKAIEGIQTLERVID